MAQRDEHGNAPIVYTHLSGLLSAGQVLVLHRSPRLLSVEQLTPEEGQALVPLLQAFPASASYALVLASIEERAVEEAQDRLNTAWLQGEAAWTASLQPLRTVGGKLHHKLHACGMDIVAVQRRGSLLKQWKEQP
jgi:hypothetical protein